MKESLKNNAKAISLMLVCAISISVAQMLWKIPPALTLIYLAGGVLVYGIGAVCMILALRMGELSMLQPINSICMVFSLFIGYFVFDEEITFTRIAGVAVIMAGIVLLSASGKKKEESL